MGVAAVLIVVAEILGKAGVRRRSKLWKKLPYSRICTSTKSSTKWRKSVAVEPRRKDVAEDVVLKKVVCWLLLMLLRLTTAGGPAR